MFCLASVILHADFYPCINTSSSQIILYQETLVNAELLLGNNGLLLFFL